jgi:hypothetical protein
MPDREIPALVAREIDTAVASAIQFGVSAEVFLAFVRESWRHALIEKRAADDQVFSRAHPHQDTRGEVK